jgi:hypothetical protein
MKASALSLRAICGEVCRDSFGWFLLVEDHWRDRLKILRWNEAVAQQDGTRCACCVAHVRELVAHWMATGSLDHPFASVSAFENWINKCLDRDFGTKPTSHGVMGNVIGEVAVHRESLRYALRDGTQSLSSTLEALLRGLEENNEASTDLELELLPS